MQKRVILVMKKYVIEPLGVMHLAGIARDLGWDARVHLYESVDGKFNLNPLYEEVREFKPNLVGPSIWTGSHPQLFQAADYIRRELRTPVAIGGPHATYYTDDCRKHADMVAKGESFRIFAEMLGASPSGRVIEQVPGIFFDPHPKETPFPIPYRDAVYRRYPDLARSPIKSIMCSTGCPFHCTYCNSPHLNKMYEVEGDSSGFKNVFRVREVDDIIAEAKWVMEHYPETKMFYFQDDIFGYDMVWLKEFAAKWRKTFGDKVKWHCQVRLELVRGNVGDRRMELFAEGGCSGITLAIESGNDWLREFVLKRPMEHEMIVSGCKKIMSYGLTLRTEQILQVAFSDFETDLSTLQLNCEINPQMAWSSILYPFGETDMGKIAMRFLMSDADPDKADEGFYFTYSQLRHLVGGRAAIEEIVRKFAKGGHRFDSPLLKMRAQMMPSNDTVAEVFFEDPNLIQIAGMKKKPICQVRFMTPEENTRYCDQTSRLQRLFNWFSKVPRGHELARKWVGLQKHEWTFAKLGELTEEHLRECGYGDRARDWKEQFAVKLGCDVYNLPLGIRDNPLYFCFFPSGHEFARRVEEKGIFNLEPWKFFDALGGEARRWLFSRFVYKTDGAEPPIAKA
ncbi:MAG: cobalamin B12-binding domain-containing protein [Candidatus Liptonbacteria bacterium]|nr:cobalamin B12-binding domain-containing protein [Parcubacteria group bacterium]MBI4087363.1 cobalamin B12-binding domain-containing protein [Candidatus Liptonbacteria bacterium]